MGATSGMACACCRHATAASRSPPRRRRLTTQGLRIRPACNVYRRGRDTHARCALATLFEILSQILARRVLCDRISGSVADAWRGWFATGLRGVSQVVGCAVGVVFARVQALGVVGRLDLVGVGGWYLIVGLWW